MPMLVHTSDVLGDGTWPPSIGDQITKKLRDAIVYAELLPGARLKQEELARQLGTSRVPLREAMRQLSAEGLIEWTSNRTAIVRSLEIEEIQELFELAAVLESRATYHGVPNLDDVDIQTLKRLNREIEQKRIDLRAWYEKNLEFHLLPMLRSRQRHTVNMVAAIRSNLTRFFMIPSLYGEPDGEWHKHHRDQHHELLVAFEARDAKRAKRLVEADWRGAWSHWRPRLERGLLLSERARDTA